MEMLHHFYNDYGSTTPQVVTQSILLINSNKIITKQMEKVIPETENLFLGCVQTVNCLERDVIAKKPDLIIINIATEGKFDGYQLAKLVKLDYDIPFYILYGEANQKEKKWAEELNPDGFIYYSPNLNLLGLRLKKAIC